jgi:hypothetical protein
MEFRKECFEVAQEVLAVLVVFEDVAALNTTDDHMVQNAWSI